MATLDVDGARLHYVEEGEGTHSLVFIHGWCSRLEHWDAQAEAFRDTYRIVRVDRRGMGRSTRPDPTTAPAPATAAAGAAQHADDVAAVLDAVGIERAVVFAHAGGGSSGLTFAVRHAERTDALVLVDTVLHRGGLVLEDDPFARRVEGMATALGAEDGDTYLRSTYAAYFGPRVPQEVSDLAVEHAVGLPRDLAIADLRLGLADTVGLAGAVTCPVLWVSARAEDTATVRTAFTGAPVAIGHVVGSGHFVQVEVPEQFNAMTARFLEARFPSTGR